MQLEILTIYLTLITRFDSQRLIFEIITSIDLGSTVFLSKVANLVGIKGQSEMFDTMHRCLCTNKMGKIFMYVI